MVLELLNLGIIISIVLFMSQRLTKIWFLLFRLIKLVTFRRSLTAAYLLALLVTVTSLPLVLTILQWDSFVWIMIPRFTIPLSWPPHVRSVGNIFMQPLVTRVLLFSNVLFLLSLV